MNYIVFNKKKQIPVKTNKPLTVQEAVKLCEELNRIQNIHEVREIK